jgi:hypothetical protein
MGNTIRHNGTASDAQRARYAIVAGRRNKRQNRAEEIALDNRAFNARIGYSR